LPATQLAYGLWRSATDMKDMDINGQWAVNFRQMESEQFPFFEFFAGGGMAGPGLGSDTRCTFANDTCEKRASSYRSCFGNGETHVEDAAKLKAGTLVWGSFPRQDLSFAGNGAGRGRGRQGKCS